MSSICGSAKDRLITARIAIPKDVNARAAFIDHGCSCAGCTDPGKWCFPLASGPHLAAVHRYDYIQFSWRRAQHDGSDAVRRLWYIRSSLTPTWTESISGEMKLFPGATGTLAACPIVLGYN